MSAGVWALCGKLLRLGNSIQFNQGSFPPRLVKLELPGQKERDLLAELPHPCFPRGRLDLSL